MLKRSGKLILLGIVLILLSSGVFAFDNSTPNNVSYDCIGDNPLAVVRHFKLDEFSGTLAEDSCIGGNNGSVIIGDFRSAKISNGLYLDATSENLNTSYNIVSNSAYTFITWINGSIVNGRDIFFAGHLAGGAAKHFRFHTYTDGGTNDLRIQLDDGTSQTSCLWKHALNIFINNPAAFHSVSLSMGTNWELCSNLKLYIDGILNETIASEETLENAVDIGSLFVGGGNASNYNRGVIDEVLIMEGNITAQQAFDINLSDWGGVAPPPPPQPTDEFINFTGLFPLNNTQYGFNTLNFNTSVNATNDFTARLYFNGTLNQTRTFSAGKNVFVSFNATLPDTDYNFQINASETSNATRNDTTGINIFFIDSTFPSLITSFKINSVFYNNFLIANFNLTDNINLLTYNISIDGIQKDYFTGINNSFYQLNFSSDLENISVGVHNLSIFIADGHTSKFIPDWDHSSNPLTKSLTYNFDDDWVKIIPQGFDFFDSFNTNKKFDRYSFNHNRAFFSEKQIYTVKSSKKIVVVKNSLFPGWLVIPSLNKWIDFDVEQSYKDVTVKVINDFEIEITIDGLENKDLTFNSIGDLNTLTKSYQFFVGNVTTTLTTPILETELTSYTASFEINSSFITDIGATLNLNGSLISPDTKITSGNYINFSYSRVTPLTNKILYLQTSWNYTIVGINNSEVNSTDNQTQLILDFSLLSCDQSNENVTLVLIPLEEEKDLPIQNVSVGISLDFFIDQENITKKTVAFNFTGIGDPTNGFNYSICLEPKNKSFLVDAFIDYEKETFSQRNYFLRKFKIGNNNISKVFLYLINDSIDSDVTIELTNEEDDPLVEYFVKVLRFFPGNNSFKTVEIGRTSNEGKALVRLIQNDVWYKFIINSDNTTIFISNVQKVLSTSLFIQIITGDSFLGTIEKVQSLDFSFTYDNVTGIYLFVWNDLNNIVRQGKLRVVQKGVGDTVICDDVVSSTAGSISCAINTSIEAIFIGTAYIDTTTKNSLFPLKVIETYLLEEFKQFGVLGLFIQILILNVMVGIGLWRPSAALIFCALSVIIGGVTGIVGMTYGTILVLVCLIALFIGLIRD